jgi:hypothetical protein
VAAQDHSDARLRHGDAELLEFPDDPEVAPARVSLARRQIRSTVALARDARPGRRCGWVQRLRTSERCQPRIVCGVTKNDPQRSRGYETKGQADQSAIGPAEVGTCDLTATHGQLMAKHQDLGILGGRIHAKEAKCLKDSSDE